MKRWMRDRRTSSSTAVFDDVKFETRNCWTTRAYSYEANPARQRQQNHRAQDLWKNATALQVLGEGGGSVVRVRQEQRPQEQQVQVRRFLLFGVAEIVDINKWNRQLNGHLDLHVTHQLLGLPTVFQARPRRAGVTVGVTAALLPRVVRAISPDGHSGPRCPGPPAARGTVGVGSGAPMGVVPRVETVSGSSRALRRTCGSCAQCTARACPGR